MDRIRKSLLVPALSALCVLTLLGSGEANAQITHIDSLELPGLRLQSSGLFGDLLDDPSSLLGDARVQDYDYEDDDAQASADSPPDDPDGVDIDIDVDMADAVNV